MAKQAPTLRMYDEVCAPIGVEEASALLGWSAATLKKFTEPRTQADLEQEWRWIKGVCYFQSNPKSSATYNRFVILAWLTARSLGDPNVYLRAVSKFNEAIKS